MPPSLRSTQRFVSSLSSQSSSLSVPSTSYTSCLSPSSSSLPSRLPRSQTRKSPFSTTPSRGTKKRQAMFNWLNGPGSVFKEPAVGSTNYLSAYDRWGKLLRIMEPKEGEPTTEGDAAPIPDETKADLRPFPKNRSFVSESVLSEELRNKIYEDVVVRGQSVRTVSVHFNVDMRRVAAVIRLVELEKKWQKENKPLATPYARAIHQMVPTTKLAKGAEQAPHESINDLPVHRLAEEQMFYPVSESRVFTRTDAGRVFSAAPALPHPKGVVNPAEAITRVVEDHRNIERVGKGLNEHEVLLPADVRIPHPELVAYEHDRTKYVSELRLRDKALKDRLAAADANDVARTVRRKKKQEAKLTRVESENGRFEFRFRDVVVSREGTGMNGRGTDAPGRRYGVPVADRKRGTVKIPTKVEV